MLPVGNLASQLAPQKGCARFTAMDALRRDLIVDRMDSQKLEWGAIAKKVSSSPTQSHRRPCLEREGNCSSVQAICQARGRGYRACGLQDVTPRLALVVSAPFTFPLGAVIAPVKAQTSQIRCYYLEIVGKNSPNWDQTEKVRKPLKPTGLTFADTLGLRRSLAFMIADVTHWAE